MDWKKRWQKILFPVDLGYRKIIEEELSRACWDLYRHVAAGICALQAVMIMLFSIKPGGPFFNWRRTGYVLSDTLLLLCTAILLWMGRKKRPGDAALLRMGMVYSGVFCVWACVITSLDQLGGNGIAVFSYVLLCVAALALLRPLMAMAFFGGSLVVLNLTLAFLPGGMENLFSNLINSVCIVLLALYISITTYRGKVLDCYSRIVIRRQYDEIIAMNAQLSEIASTDQLTGLGNRRGMEEILRPAMESAISQGVPVTGMMLDIDHFKEFNDRYGHLEGDRILRELAETLVEATRRENAFAARYGGEEFFFCLEKCGQSRGLEVAQALRVAVERRFEGALTISVGVCTQEPGKALDFRDLVNRADVALYRAKMAGRNRVESFAGEELRQ
ncbi:MAG: GGDEF domain-containing protein [Oscillospiraceae bacterium]|nr:GGDEF domain-containing protein [Oscillospiraceae bacterium]